MALNSEIQTNQILTNDDEVCIPRPSSILLAVLHTTIQQKIHSRFKTFHLAGLIFEGQFFVIGSSRYKCSHTKTDEKTSDDKSHYEFISELRLQIVN